MCERLHGTVLEECWRPAFHRRRFTSFRPVGVTYRLTAAGAALSPALAELATWAAANLPADAPPG